jgi:hypothetical protein
MSAAPRSPADHKDSVGITADDSGRHAARPAGEPMRWQADHGRALCSANMKGR